MGETERGKPLSFYFNLKTEKEIREAIISTLKESTKENAAIGIAIINTLFWVLGEIEDE